MNEHLSIPEMFENWFLDYASYVILERAVPDISDGLKPVQRRILHSMAELEDSRFNKVANLVGNTMKYHPHGDASIGDALVQLGQKNLLIDTQGNWGNILTGDSAAAPRYIEARLSKFALEVVFNPKTTVYKPSYDGRNQEPVFLPVKYPLVLAQGAEGIAVGLSTKILPHNFIELIDASIAILRGEDFEIYPDFQTGAYMDVSNYNDGKRGGRVKIRAKISQIDKKTLKIDDIPFGESTASVIDSILKANDKGKIKIKKIEDNTAENVEIIISLQPGVSPDTTIDALYAFTHCEVSISPNACIISNDKPIFTDVKEILRISTQNTQELLKKELEIRLSELSQDWHYTSLEKIFFEEKIYRELENEEAKRWEDILKNIDKAFEPYKPRLKKAITKEDIVKLTEKPVRKISKFDVKKADEHIKAIEKEIKEINEKLNSLVDYTISYFEHIKEKYSKGRERKTEIRSFDTIDSARVAASSERLYVDREEGFIGTSLKKNEYLFDCSDLDEVVVFRRDGNFIKLKVGEKIFVGKDIIHVGLYKKNDDRTIYNMVYRDGKDGYSYVKRFALGGINRDKLYCLTQGKEDSVVEYFTENPNGEAEKIKVYLKLLPNLKKKEFEYDFKNLAIKGRSSMGNIFSRTPIRKISLLSQGVSTLGELKIYFDDSVRRLNSEERGRYIGNFAGEDKILCVLQGGAYKLCGFDLNTHFEEEMLRIEKFKEGVVASVVYVDKKTGFWYLKRFELENSDKRQSFVDEDANFVSYSLAEKLKLKIKFLPDAKGRSFEDEEIDPVEFIGVKGIKAKGKRLSNREIASVEWIEETEEEEKPQAFDLFGNIN